MSQMGSAPARPAGDDLASRFPEAIFVAVLGLLLVARMADAVGHSGPGYLPFVVAPTRTRITCISPPAVTPPAPRPLDSGPQTVSARAVRIGNPPVLTRPDHVWARRALSWSR